MFPSQSDLWSVLPYVHFLFSQCFPQTSFKIFKIHTYFMGPYGFLLQWHTSSQIKFILFNQKNCHELLYYLRKKYILLVKQLCDFIIMETDTTVFQLCIYHSFVFHSLNCTFWQWKFPKKKPNQNKTKQKNKEFLSWCSGNSSQLGTTRLQVWSLVSLSGLRIQLCHELWCRSQTELGSGIAVALA